MKIQGMTLLECLVALALTSFIAVALISMVSVGRNSYQKILKTQSAYNETVFSQQLLRRLIGDMVIDGVYGNPEVVGKKDVFCFSTKTSPALLDNPSKVKLALFKSLKGGKDLTIAYGTCSSAENGLYPEILVKNIESVELSYFSRATGEWNDEWVSTNELPSVVLIKVNFSKNDSRYWPVFYAETFSTHNSNCEFDAVLQDCRAVK
jgi:type II secretory pathway pseudopilin PulG